MKRRFRQWTAEEVLNELRRVDELSAKHNQRVRSCLYGAALRYFGSWREAVQAAGFDYAAVAKRRLPGYWKKERIIEEIRGLPEGNSNYVRSQRADLYSAALRQFGTWKYAVEAAGLNYDSVRKGWLASDDY